MSNILSIINSIPQSRVALLNSERLYTYKDLVELELSNRNAIEKLRNSSVVINGRERLEFALLLTMLDGAVSKILFLPHDIDKKLHQKYYNEAKIEYEVFLEDGKLKFNKVADKIVNEELSTQIQTEWIVPTSGTTNIPKLVSHSFESLTRSTKINIKRGGEFRWGLAFDIYRFSGIQVFLQSILSGSTLIVTNPADSMSKMLSLLADKECNALSATPSFWRKVLMSKEADRLNLKVITLGGEISDNNILQALKQKYPEAKISHIYASTEVGVGFSVTDCKEGFPVSYLYEGIDGLKLKVDDEDILWIAPKDREQKYLSDDKMYNEEGYINTGDRVKIKDQRVYFLGRDSGSINVGGNKVQPEEVENILLSSGMLNGAYVYAIKNPMMGSLVCADIILKDSTIDKKEAKNKILKYCREHLEGFKVPAIVKFVQELETTQSGKLRRSK